jgi:polyisoprenoid-binding protein YceI
MRVAVSPESRVLLDLQATGLLRAIGHSPTLSCPVEPLAWTVDEEADAFEVAVQSRFRADAIQPPSDIPAADRDAMRANLLGAEVLDAGRFPVVEFRGCYAGTLGAGVLSGDLVVRGAPRPIAIDVRIARDTGTFVATGQWEGRLTDLGIKPFRALLGALKLKDWIRIRLDARLAGR